MGFDGCNFAGMPQNSLTSTALENDFSAGAGIL
jgi:hypothetical protein